MDAGATIAWPERFNYDELSAIQHAMNLKLQDERAFYAEYQNEPLPEDTPQEDELTADQVAAKVNRLHRGDVPVGCNHLTMFVNVQAALLYYVVAGWEDGFTGFVLDYGTYPDQKRPYFTLRDAQPTLSQAANGAGLEGSIYAGLEALTAHCLGREWRRTTAPACGSTAAWSTPTGVPRPTWSTSSAGKVPIPPFSIRATGVSSVRRAFPSLSTNASWETASGSTGGSPMSMASGRCGTWCSTRTTGSRLSILAWPWRWATPGVCPSSGTAPRSTGYSPTRSLPNTA